MKPPVVVGGVLLVALVAAIVALRHGQTPSDTPSGSQRAALNAGCGAAQSAFAAHRSDVWVTVSGRVARDLPDSQGQYTHQRFIVRCATGGTLLIVNDVSIGQRAPASVGERVAVRGEYIWNGQGGLIHFTHHDPAGGRGGWIEEGGRVYS
jgi:hypothetical protein